jgi:hypothetical protein
MKSYKLIIIILIVFLQTGNVLSKINIFDVNNILVEKKGKTSNDKLANKAITKGFKELLSKILLVEDIKKLQELGLSEIKDLVKYYQVSSKKSDDTGLEKINFNISYDKDKIHDLFYKKGIPYSEIIDKELFILPILKKDNQIFIYNKNFLYDKWNDFSDIDLLEFILPLENIEIIQYVNLRINNILNLELKDLFKEYRDKNLALVLFEDRNKKEEKIYFKTKILDKSFLKNIDIKRENLDQEDFYKKIITTTKKEITNLIKSQNLIDVRAPSFLKVQLKTSEKNNLAILKSKLRKIEAIEDIYIQEFNNKSVFLKIKYLGKLDKIINQLENNKIILQLINDQWSIKII